MVFSRQKSMSEKILIVDDDPDTLNFCCEALAEEQFEIVTAPNGIEALALSGEVEFDLVLTDIRMPGMDGIELLDALKKRDPDQMTVVFSGFGDVDVALEAMKAGAFDSLSKPLILDELKLTIGRALRQNRLRQENEQLKQVIQDSYIAMVTPPKVIPLLHGFNAEAAREFIELGRVVNFSSNEIILEENQLDTDLYIVFEGEIKVWQESAEVFKLSKGDSCGEMIFFRPNVRSQLLEAEVPGSVLIIHKEAIMAYFSQKEERLFKLFVINSLNTVYAKYRKTINRVVQLERLLKG
jgi:DNA-binding response OmpR family regulator